MSLSGFEKKVPVEPVSLFRIASLSKPFTKEEIFDPLSIRRMRLGKNLLIDRAPRTVIYYDSRERKGPAISGPEIGKQLPLPYDVEGLETMDANGGWIASAVDFDSTIDPMLHQTTRTIKNWPEENLFVNVDGLASTAGN